MWEKNLNTMLYDICYNVLEIVWYGDLKDFIDIANLYFGKDFNYGDACELHDD